MWNRPREGLQTLKNEGLLRTWYEGTDRYHLSERLCEALKLCGLPEAERQRLLDDWHARFDHSDATTDTIERYLRRKYHELAPI